MNIEILLYVALGLIWLVLQGLGRKNKRQQQTVPAQPQRPPVTLQDVLGEMEWVPKNEAPVPPEAQPVGHLPAPRPQPAPQPLQLLPKPKVKVPKGERKTLVDQLRDPQTAQSAVIAAEILAKPRAYRRRL